MDYTCKLKRTTNSKITPTQSRDADLAWDDIERRVKANMVRHGTWGPNLNIGPSKNKVEDAFEEYYEGLGMDSGNPNAVKRATLIYLGQKKRKDKIGGKSIRSKRSKRKSLTKRKTRKYKRKTKKYKRSKI